MGPCSLRINSDAHAKLDHSKTNALHRDNTLHITATWNLLIEGKTRHLHYLVCSQCRRFMVHLPASGPVYTLELREDKILCAIGLTWQ